MILCLNSHFFFFNDTATTEIYTLSLHDALPIYHRASAGLTDDVGDHVADELAVAHFGGLQSARACSVARVCTERKDRKSTRLNSSHANISYAVFCLKKKKNTISPLVIHIY